MPELRLEHIGKSYRGLPAVTEMEYVFQRGIYGLLGANGAGKTTLLRTYGRGISENAGVSASGIRLLP